MPSLHSIAGITAGLLALIGFIPYITSTIKGVNRPNRATWIIWGVVSVLLLASYKTAGATDAIWTSVANTLCFGAVIVLSFKFGVGGFSRLDVACLVAAFAGVCLWWIFDSPLPTLYLSIIIDFVGAIPTLKKAYLDPAGENKTTWVIFWIANTLNLFAIHTFTRDMALYPLYLFFISGMILFILIVRKNKRA